VEIVHIIAIVSSNSSSSKVDMTVHDASDTRVEYILYLRRIGLGSEQKRE